MEEQAAKQVKCLIWDLDRTLWEGVLSEGGSTALREGVRETLAELDRRGILLSIASKNEAAPAMKVLKDLGIDDLFLCPQISWDDKAVSVQRIMELLNLKPEAIAFIDDNPFERDAVQYQHPKVRVYDESAVPSLLSLPEFTPRFITPDSAARRHMYQTDLLRQQAKQTFTGSSEEFLKTLQIHVAVKRVTEDDLQRVEELTIRTHQLNATGYTYSYDELVELTHSPRHIFLVCSMHDRYGDNGKVGLLLLEHTSEEVMTLKLLIVSCRVMSYGIGSALLAYAMQLSHRLGKKLHAEFFQTEHNRIMYITYKMAGFEEIEENGDQLLLSYAGEEVPTPPAYIIWDTSEAEA